MAEQNPIKYSDLIVPDDSIEKLIQQLEQLQTVFAGLSNEIKAEAAAMAQALKSVSGATEQGRASTKGAAAEAERLAQAQEKLAFAQSETAKQLMGLKEEQRKANMETKLEVQLSNAAEGSYNALSAQYRINKMALNALSKEERENTQAGRDLVRTTKEIHDRMNELQKETGNFSLNVGNYTNSILEAIGVHTKWFKTLQQLGSMFGGGFKQSIQSAGTAVAGFGKQLLALMANPIVATIAGITAAFMALSKGISSSEENTNTLMRILAPFQRILTGVVNVLQTATGWILKGVEGFEKLAMGASRLMERLPLVGSAFKKVNNALEENIRLTREKQALEKDNRDYTVTEAMLLRNVAKWRRDAERTSDPKRRVQLLKMANAAEERIMLDKVDLAKRQVAVLEAEAAQAQNTKEANEKLAQAKANLYQVEAQYYQRTTRLQSKIRTNEEKMNASGGGSGKTKATDDAEREAKELERIQKEKDARLLAAMRQAQDAKVDLMENEYDRQRAQAIYSFDRQIEDTKKKMSELGSDEVETKKYYDDLLVSLEQQKWDRLSDIADREMKAYADAEAKDLEQRLRATDKLIREQEKASKGRKDMYDILGFKLDDEQKQAIDESLQYAMESLNTFMDAWIDAAERKREIADEEVERAQSVLDAEIEARNNGYAYNVMQAQKELDMAKRNQEKAIREQQRAQKAQQAIDAATQVSSLITASANIWSSFTKMGPWGIAAAIAATAVMFGAFAAAKVQAMKATTSGTEEYGEGTVELLQGGSHQSGNDIDLGRKKDGTRRRAEGGEYFAVINKRNSRRYGELIPQVINALNDGTFAQKYMGAYNDAGMTVNVGQAPDISRLADDVRMIRKQGETERYVDGKGSTVIQYKNLTRTIRV